MKTTHIWDGSNIALELNTSNTVSARYIRGVNLIKTDKNVYFLYNAHGDVVQLTNSSGAVTKNYRYDAFGVEIGKAENDTNPWRYCGEYWDEETGTVYLRARRYDPRTGRFLSEDPIRDGLNWYTYCANSPTLYIDYTGRSVILAALAIASVILLAGCGSGDTSSSSTSPPSFGGGTAGRNGAGRATPTQSPMPSPTPSPISSVLPTNRMDISDELLSFVASYETYSQMPYTGQDSQNRTVGYGHVITKSDGTKYNNGISKEDALLLLKSDLNVSINAVNDFIVSNSISLTQNQFDALVSFTFNVGTGWLTNNNVQDLRNILLSGNLDYDTMYNEFMDWIKVNGERSLGLYRRRMDELNIFFDGDYSRNYPDKPSWF